MPITRAAVFVACIVLSLAGPFFAALGLPFLLHSAGWPVWLLFWFAAAFSLCRLASAWMDDRRLGKREALLALGLGLMAHAALPLQTLLVDPQARSLDAVMPIVGIQAVLILPIQLLAIILTLFHAITPPKA